MVTFDSTLYFITDSSLYEEDEFLTRVEEGLKGGATLLSFGKRISPPRTIWTLLIRCIQSLRSTRFH